MNLIEQYSALKMKYLHKWADDCWYFCNLWSWHYSDQSTPTWQVLTFISCRHFCFRSSDSYSSSQLYLSVIICSNILQLIKETQQKQQKAEKKLYYIENDFSNQDISLKKALFDLKGHELIQLECCAAQEHKRTPKK